MEESECENVINKRKRERTGKRFKKKKEMNKRITRK